MRISTCGYMRFKMKISDTDKGTLCNEDCIETLEHIFLECKTTKNFLISLNSFIRSNVLQLYDDQRMFFFMFCCHEIELINCLNLISKWYISRCHQTSVPLIWDTFINKIKKMLCGDRNSITEPLLKVLGS